MSFIRITLLLFGLTIIGLSPFSARDTHASTQKKILVMGDSLSAAYRLPVEKGWVAILQAKLAEQQFPVSIVNASVSGATTAAGLKILPPALVQHKPDIVILALGANDGLQGKPISYITANLDKLIKLSIAESAEVLLLGIRIPPNYGLAYTEPFFAQYQHLSEKYDTALVPFFLDGVAGDVTLMMDDGKHPNAAGQRLVFENVWPSIQALLEN